MAKVGVDLTAAEVMNMKVAMKAQVDKGKEH